MIVTLSERCFDREDGQRVDELVINTKDWILSVSMGYHYLINLSNRDWYFTMTDCGYKKVKSAMMLDRERV